MSQCMIYDGTENADEEGAFFDYRERIALSNGKVRCCETGVVIPEGFPYALCEGKCSYDGGEPDWDDFPQALEMWRLLRSMHFRKQACFCFGSVFDEIEYLDEYPEGKMLAVQLVSTKNRIASRYAEGKQPRLHPSERISLENGIPVAKLPFTTRTPPPTHAPVTTEEVDQKGGE